MTIKEEIQKLQNEYDNSDDFIEKSEIRDKILKLKLETGEAQICNSEEECEACGS